jgi:quinol-cytochrome oxidoreductase complex cytochrome b subunit
MNEKNSYEAGFESDAMKAPRRIVFITRKTSAKVTGAPGRQLMSYPHVVLREAAAFELLTIVLVIFSLLWDAPLEQLADPLLTPNPAKAPWYFLGLQELLHYFPPLVAGVVIPALVIVALVIIPYFNVNVTGAPLRADIQGRRWTILAAAPLAALVFFGLYRAWSIFIPTVAVGALAALSPFVPAGRGRFREFLRSRALSWWVMTWFIVVAVILTGVGTFFRGPGWSWVWPWR